MIIWIILILVAVIIGYFIGKYFTEKAKFGDKQALLKAEWEKKISNIEKDYEIKLEKGNSLLEKIKEENKTHLEKLAKDWEVKYVQDISELKKLFKESEKIIKTKSVSSSRRSLVGKFIERFIPFLKNIPYEASDMHFMGQPIDYIVFEGLHKDNIEKVTFLEVKTGESKLTKREKSLKDAIQKRKVSWEEIRVDTDGNGAPDKEMENEETSIDDLYGNLDKKLSSIKNKNLVLENEEKEESDWKCEYCGEPFVLDEDELEELEEEGFLEIKCPNCRKKLICKSN